MKRDMDLIRKLCLTIEAADRPLQASAVAIEGYDSAAIVYHANLLDDAGLVEATECGTRACRDNLTLWRLTSAGHDFLDAARNEGLWQRVKQQVGERLASIPLDALQQVLTQVAVQIVT